MNLSEENLRSKLQNRKILKFYMRELWKLSEKDHRVYLELYYLIINHVITVSYAGDLWLQFEPLEAGRGFFRSDLYWRVPPPPPLLDARVAGEGDLC